VSFVSHPLIVARIGCQISAHLPRICADSVPNVVTRAYGCP
jgi:hypothetical protein